MELMAIDDGDGSPRFVQTERETHEAWARLTIEAPKASAVMHLITARMKRNNRTLLTHAEIQRELGISRPTVQRAIKHLREGRWLEVYQIGETGSANIYGINSRVAWATGRDGLRYADLSVELRIREKDQPEEYRAQIGSPPLRQLPHIQSGEAQMPAGDGLPPVSQPFLAGMEPDLPARREDGDADISRGQSDNYPITQLDTHVIGKGE